MSQEVGCNESLAAEELMGSGKSLEIVYLFSDNWRIAMEVFSSIYCAQVLSGKCYLVLGMC